MTTTTTTTTSSLGRPNASFVRNPDWPHIISASPRPAPRCAMHARLVALPRPSLNRSLRQSLTCSMPLAARGISARMQQSGLSASDCIVHSKLFGATYYSYAFTCCTELTKLESRRALDYRGGPRRRQPSLVWLAFSPQLRTLNYSLSLFSSLNPKMTSRSCRLQSRHNSKRYTQSSKACVGCQHLRSLLPQPGCW